MYSLCREVESCDHHFFFGYYDKSPFSLDNKLHLCHRVSFNNRLPLYQDQCDIGYYILDSGEFVPVAKSSAFNWQQASQLQWVNALSPLTIAFNCFSENLLLSCILDLSSGLFSHIPHPIYAISPSSPLAATIDYRHHSIIRRGYSYDFSSSQETNWPSEHALIATVNLLTHAFSVIVTLDDLIPHYKSSGISPSDLYVEHLSFSPSGDLLAFQARHRLADGGISTMLFTYDFATSTLTPVLSSGRCTHYSWLSDTSIIAYGSLFSYSSSIRKNRIISNYLIKPLKPLYHRLVGGTGIQGHNLISRAVTQESYILIDLVDPSASCRVLPSLNRDGHPTSLPFSPGKILTDTYPSPPYGSSLIIADINSDYIHVVDKIPPSLYDNTPLRCDLHPKSSYDGSLLSIDAVSPDGQRSIKVYSSNA